MEGKEKVMFGEAGGDEHEARQGAPKRPRGTGGVIRDLFDADEEVTSAGSQKDFATVEVTIGRLKASQVRVPTLEVISALRGRLRHQHFEQPVDPAIASGYYSDTSLTTTKWNTDVMCFEMIEKKEKDNVYVKQAKRVYGEDRADLCHSFVERDFNLIIYNAIIFNNKKHKVNEAALRFFHALRKVLDDKHWDECCFCRECGGDEVYLENTVMLCDWCCTGIHRRCLKQERPANQGIHPLRKDEAWFCQDKCREAFEALAAYFELPEKVVQFPPAG
jgi:hypothetical protein